MRTPVTSVDERFSQPEVSPTPWDETVAIIERAQMFWLATVRVDGRPHVTPLVAVWRNDAVYFATGPSEQKARNLESNQHVVLTTGNSDWDTGIDVIIEGTARLAMTDSDVVEVTKAWGTKWDGQWDYRAEDGKVFQEDAEVLLFCVKPEKVFAFSKGTFIHTVHRFEDD